jgi:hypothetical protein
MQPRDGEEESAVATTLLVAPQFLRDDFEAFNDFVIWLEEDMFGASVGLASDGGADGGEDGELLGDAVAVAGFHPLWKFGGCDDEAAIHWVSGPTAGARRANSTCTMARTMARTMT